MNAFKILVGMFGVSLLLGTGAFAEMKGGEPGTSNNPADNVPDQIQRSSPSGEESLPGGSGPGDRSDALTDMGNEKAVKKGHAELEKNVNKTEGGGAAMAAEELQQRSTEKSKKGISAQSSKEAEKKKAE
jgi:hypothetical protein